jgi:hypothetical protein
MRDEKQLGGFVDVLASATLPKAISKPSGEFARFLVSHGLATKADVMSKEEEAARKAERKADALKRKLRSISLQTGTIEKIDIEVRRLKSLGVHIATRDQVVSSALAALKGAH